MIGRANIRDVEKFEYNITARNMSFTSNKNGIYELTQNSLDSLTPVTITDGGGYI